MGVDVNTSKVDRMNSGVASIVEPEVPELLLAGHQQNRLSATTSADEAVHSSDISLVCVGTPSQANGNLDLTYMKRVCEGDRGRAAQQAVDSIWSCFGARCCPVRRRMS